MLTLRLALRFCRAKSYITQFDALESNVNRLEIEILQKKEELSKFQQITQLSKTQYFIKQIMKLANQPYQYAALTQERNTISDLHQEFKQLSDVGEQRANVMKKLKKEEQDAVETVFLTDLARFSLKYEEFVKESNMPEDIQTGLELSHKALSKLLSTENVEFIGNTGDYVDPELHSVVQGNSQTVKQVQSKGFKVKGKLIEKAKVK